MIFLKSLLFPVFNIGLGLFLVNGILVALFYPSKEWKIGSLKIPLTPALIYSQKRRIIAKLYHLLNDFLTNCSNFNNDNIVSKIEAEVHKMIVEQLKVIDNISYLPELIKEKIKSICSDIIFKIVRYIIRTLIPFLAEQYMVESYIDLLDEAIDVEVLKKYYLEYIHKYLTYAAISIFFLLGLYNMIVYLIIT